MCEKVAHAIRCTGTVPNESRASPTELQSRPGTPPKSDSEIDPQNHATKSENGAQISFLGDHFGIIFKILCITLAMLSQPCLWHPMEGLKRPPRHSKSLTFRSDPLAVEAALARSTVGLGSQFRREPLSYMMIRRRNNKSIYIYVYILIKPTKVG